VEKQYEQHTVVTWKTASNTTLITKVKFSLVLPITCHEGTKGKYWSTRS